MKVGIVGGAGFAAGELLRLLLIHPNVEIGSVLSKSQSGKPLSSLHRDLTGETDLFFSENTSDLEECELIFLAGAHGKSRELLEEINPSEIQRIIDLSTDFRHEESRSWHDREFVYGLTESNRELVREANSVANPGCFATALSLALLPFAANSILSSDIHAHGITGSTGAGAALRETTHFSWRDSNVSVYKPFSHQHLKEVTEQVRREQQEFLAPIRFLPVRGNFTRGIYMSVYFQSELKESESNQLVSQYFANSPFTLVSDERPSLKEVVNTNKALVHVSKHEEIVLVTTVIDNLLKGAAGQAVENMNLMFGFDHTTGLRLKGSYH